MLKKSENTKNESTSRDETRAKSRQTQEIKLSLVIVSWNTAGYLRNCLQSIFNSVPATAFEVIIVDNASTDSTVSMVQREFPGVDLIINESNLGFARACNQGWRKAKGQFILFLNPDTLLLPGTLDGAVKIMEASKNIGLLGIRNLDGRGRPRRSSYDFPSPLRTFAFITGLNELLPPSRCRQEKNRQAAGYIPGSFLLARRQVLEELGGFDENFFMYGEDADLCWRAWKKGWYVLYEPALSLIHFGSKSRQNRWPIITDYIQSVLYFYRKNLPQEYKKLYLAIKVSLAFLWLKSLMLRSFSPSALMEEWKKINDLWHSLKGKNRKNN